jgi:hypothetical protein
MATFAPAMSNAMAVAAPMPPDAPVISTTLSLSEIKIFSLRLKMDTVINHRLQGLTQTYTENNPFLSVNIRFIRVQKKLESK